MTEANRAYWQRFWRQRPHRVYTADDVTVPSPLVDYLLGCLRRHRGEGAPVLELGCGSGLPALTLAAHGYRVLATDLSPEAVAAVRESASALSAARGAELPLVAREADLRDLSGLSAYGPFGLVFNCSTFEYLTPPEAAAAARQIAGLLTDDGGCVLVLPHRNLAARFAGLLYYLREQHDREEVQNYSPEMLAKLLAPSGLQLVAREYMGSIPAGTAADYASSRWFARTIAVINRIFALLPCFMRPLLAFNVLLVFERRPTAVVIA